MKSWLIVSAVLVLFLCGRGQLALAETKAAPPQSMPEEQLVEGVGCKLGQEARRLEVHTKEAGCSLQYFRSGKNKEIAAAKHGVQLCKDKLKQVRGTLETAGYKCE